MPDICMCKGDDCPDKGKCYRYTAEPSYRQSWFMEIPYNKEIGVCEHFWAYGPGGRKENV